MEDLRQLLWTLVVLLVIKVSIQQDVTDQDNIFYQEHDEFPKDCQEVKDSCAQNENRASGVFLIRPEGCEEPFEVFCDHETDGGGWTVFQRRQDNSTDFARPWQYYKKGFGFLSQEFWLGNDRLAYLTNQRKYVLRIDFDPSSRRNQWVLYDHFQITDERGSYKLVNLGEYSFEGSFKDRMDVQEGSKFSTQDRATGSCDGAHGAGGWWFTDDCRKPNLNGELGGNGTERLHWGNSDNPTFTEMKIRPVELV